MSLFQAIIIGILSCLAASVPAMAGTTVGNYTMNRPLVAGLLLGLVFGDIRGCVLLSIPMQMMWIAVVTPGGTVPADLRAVSYIGIPLAYVGAKAAGLDFASDEAFQLASSISAMTGVIGVTMFYGTSMMNLIWQHWGWAQIEKGNIECVGLVDAVLPWITNIIISFLPVTLLCFYGQSAVEMVFSKLDTANPQWYLKGILSVGSLLPAVGISILLKSVVTKYSDLIFFLAGFTMAASMGLTLLGATAVGAVFALIDYKMAMNRIAAQNAGGGNSDFDDEEDI
jgi:PTS system mannose-specific IIC component